MADDLGVELRKLGHNHKRNQAWQNYRVYSQAEIQVTHNP
jgi:hypothetical protein